jgi:catechol 2,3-dioxygenase-like lactoylglutathione lyase family enzyme
MSAQLDHTIVHARNKEASARFLTEMLGLPEAEPYGPFMVVELTNGVNLDFMETDGEIATQHYAFLVDEPDFDAIVERIQDRGIAHWADPGRRRPGEINHHEGGRGVYFVDPDGHFLEALTRPYGSDG